MLECEGFFFNLKNILKITMPLIWLENTDGRNTEIETSIGSIRKYDAVSS